ncbi:hypothetical protein [Sulfuricurvum sp.]|nr:hypothetical protein [Sulfuricurvum sp.]MDD2782070.1 hypothetical protein [Sulfuricurvum sp.]
MEKIRKRSRGSRAPDASSALLAFAQDNEEQTIFTQELSPW